jgi:ubiquinone/menaquinone biosynthesis C-methylase UbiE
VTKLSATDNTQRFTGRAADYDQYRERYDPAILLPRLRDWCGLTPDWLIADIGAGTGMLADVFLTHGNHVLAVEPNAEMRQACAVLHPNQPLLQLIDGTAEATTLADHSVNLVCCGRALHWFEIDHAMAEFRRILKPEGWFVSVAFGRADDGSDENIAIEELLRSLTTSPASTQETYAKYARLPDFLLRDYRHERIAGSMHLTWPELFGLVRSLSHAPLPSDPRFPAFEATLRELFERYAVDSRIELTTRYWINAGMF